MAKGNMLLGYSRGSVGDVTFYRSKGAQQARARNRKPNNPKSNKQVLQRSLLANCVKFYKVATKGLFKFAFENKKPNESDYNAFVRVNIKRGINISKTAFDTEWYGGIGYWRMTEGSLQSIATLMSNSKLHFDFGVETTDEVPNNATVGWLSSQLINGNPNRYMAGDIITFCGVIFKTPGNGMPSVQPTASNDNFDTSFGTVQFRLNTADTTEVADATGATCHVVKVGNKLCLGLTPSESAAATFWAQGIQGACLIHSRNTSEGTKVSTQDLATNDNWNTAVEAGKNTDYISAVLADWQASGEAILQGGASTDFENPFDLATQEFCNLQIANQVTGGISEIIEGTASDNNINIQCTQDYQYLEKYHYEYNFRTHALAQKAYDSLPGTGTGDTKTTTATITIGENTIEVSVDIILADNNVLFEIDFTGNARDMGTSGTINLQIAGAIQNITYSVAAPEVTSIKLKAAQSESSSYTEEVTITTLGQEVTLWFGSGMTIGYLTAEIDGQHLVPMNESCLTDVSGTVTYASTKNITTSQKGNFSGFTKQVVYNAAFNFVYNGISTHVKIKART